MPVFLLTDIRCYCKTKNGGRGKNEVICEEKRLGVVNTTKCESNEGCTGPTNWNDGTRYQPGLPMTTQLCQKGKYYLGCNK